MLHRFPQLARSLFDNRDIAVWKNAGFSPSAFCNIRGPNGFGTTSKLFPLEFWGDRTPIFFHHANQLLPFGGGILVA